MIGVDIGIKIEKPSYSEIHNAFYRTEITMMDENNCQGFTFPSPFDHVIYARYAFYGSCGWSACD